MSFTYGPDGSLVKNKLSRYGAIAHEHFDIQKQIESFENVANEALKHKEHFQCQNQAQNQQMHQLQSKLNNYENFMQNQEGVYNNILNAQSNKFVNHVRQQEDFFGSKISQQNQLLTQQQQLLNKQQHAIEYFNVLNEAQNNSNIKISEYYENLTNTYPEHFSME